jgi:hypothetical protein
MNKQRRNALKLAPQIGFLGGAGLLKQPTAIAKPNALSFCAIGDTPYFGTDTAALRQTFQDAVLQDCKFITHIGDIKSSWEPCSNDLLQERIALLNESSLPLFYVPGDNEWIDCGRGVLNSYNPEERLEYLRSIAIKGNSSFGKKPLPLERQSSQVNAQALPENIRWMHGQCAFVGLHVSGSYTGIGTNGIDEKKRLEREKACTIWMASATQWAEENNARALVVLAHANVNIDLGIDSERLSKKHRQAFRPFKQSLDQLLTQWKKPVLYIHGDTHRFQVNNPWSDRHPHLTRLEVFGAPFTSHWVKVSIDMDAKKPEFQVAPISLMKNER